MVSYYILRIFICLWGFLCFSSSILLLITFSVKTWTNSSYHIKDWPKYPFHLSLNQWTSELNGAGYSSMDNRLLQKHRWLRSISGKPTQAHMIVHKSCIPGVPVLNLPTAKQIRVSPLHRSCSSLRAVLVNVISFRNFLRLVRCLFLSLASFVYLHSFKKVPPRWNYYFLSKLLPSF